MSARRDAEWEKRKEPIIHAPRFSSPFAFLLTSTAFLFFSLLPRTTGLRCHGSKLAFLKSRCSVLFGRAKHVLTRRRVLPVAARSAVRSEQGVVVEEAAAVGQVCRRRQSSAGRCDQRFCRARRASMLGCGPRWCRLRRRADAG